MLMPSYSTCLVKPNRQSAQFVITKIFYQSQARKIKPSYNISRFNFNIKLLPNLTYLFSQRINLFATKNAQKKKKKKKILPRQSNTKNKQPQQTASKGNELEADRGNVPPTLLSPTASKHVFIASSALESSGLDQNALFKDTQIPNQFLKNRFEYLPTSHSVHEDLQHSGELPEVAFLGRSNVGKSSLVNALTRCKVAEVSKTPGRTQTMNYFAIVPKNEPRLIWNQIKGFFVDLPGYGFAKAPQAKIDVWQKRTQDFLIDRYEIGALKRLYFLIDPRHGIYQFDRVVMGWFDEANIPYSIILTKSDKVSLMQIVKITNEICMRYQSQVFGAHHARDRGDINNTSSMTGSQSPIVHVTSAKTGEGIPQFMLTIASDLWVDGKLPVGDEDLLEEG